MDLWIGLLAAVLAAFSGGQLVRYLTAHPLRMSGALALTLLGGCGSGILLVFGQPGLAWAVLAALAWVGGYLWQTRAVLGREESHELPQLQPPTNLQATGHMAVVYLTHGEPETFNPIGWLNQFREFDRQKTPFVPWFARPLFIHQLRNAYLKVGASRHRGMHQAMCRQLEAVLERERGVRTPCYLSFLDDEPHPDAAAIQAVNAGAREIVVVQVFVSVSNHTAEGREMIEVLQLDQHGVTVRFTGPLWDSEALHQMFVEKAVQAAGEDGRGEVGILLVGHGQPASWDEAFPTETEHELLFRERILDRLEAAGFSREKMGMAWMEFREPKPAALVEQIVQRGAKKVLYFSAAISADSIHSQYDVPELVSAARIPPGTDLVNLGAWNDHPRAIEAITREALRGMQG